MKLHLHLKGVYSYRYFWFAGDKWTPKILAHNQNLLLTQIDFLLNPNKIQISFLFIGVLNMPLGRTCYTLADSVPIAIEFQILIRRKKSQENQNEERFGAESNSRKLQGYRDPY